MLTQSCSYRLHPGYVSFKCNNNIDINNFKVIDEYVSRGSQPTKRQLKQLKENGYSIIINFRTLIVSGLDFEEKEEAERLGMEYHNIPIISANGPSDKSLERFWNIIEKARQNKQKVYIHCQRGRDRTGFMSALYKIKFKLDTTENCIKEMLEMGHNDKRFPNLIPQLRNCANKLY